MKLIDYLNRDLAEATSTSDKSRVREIWTQAALETYFERELTDYRIEPLKADDEGVVVTRFVQFWRNVSDRELDEVLKTLRTRNRQKKARAETALRKNKLRNRTNNGQSKG